MLLSVINPKRDMENDTNLTRSFWHWMAPVLSAVVSIVALGGILLQIGGSAQRLTTAEEQIKKLDSESMKKQEFKYQLDTIEKNVGEIKDELKESRKRR